LNRIEELDRLCSDVFIDDIKKLMTVKRTKSKISLKKQINFLLLDLLKSTNLINEYENLNSRNKFLMYLFLCYYISLSFRNFICGD
jgi:hypothetical protein